MKLYEEARQATTNKYVSAIPCKKCGGTLRMKSQNGMCVQCRHLNQKKHRSKLKPEPEPENRVILCKEAELANTNKYESMKACKCGCTLRLKSKQGKCYDCYIRQSEAWHKKKSLRVKPNPNSDAAIKQRRCKAERLDTGMSYREREEYRKFCEARASNSS